MLQISDQKIRRGPKLEGCTFANFGNSSGTEGEPSQKREEKWRKKEKKINAASTGNRTRDLSITDQMSVLTNQVHLKVQFRHRFDQKCPFTDSALASLEPRLFHSKLCLKITLQAMDRFHEPFGTKS